LLGVMRRKACVSSGNLRLAQKEGVKRKTTGAPKLAPLLENGSGNALAFGELEALAGALLAVLLAFVRARIAREETELLQLSAEFRVELAQRTGNAEANGAGLTDHATANRGYEDVELVRHFGGEKGLPDGRARGFVGKVVFEVALIDLDVPIAGAEEHAGDRSLAASGSQMLGQTWHSESDLLQTSMATGFWASCG